MIGLWLAAALAAPVEVYTAPHIDAHQSAQKLGVALGGAVGARFELGEYTLGGTFFAGDFQGVGATTAIEGGRYLRSDEKKYRPWMGLESVAWWGAYSIESASGGGGSGPAVSVRLAARPLVWQFDNGVTLSFAELTYGQGLEAIGRSAVGGIGGSLAKLGHLGRSPYHNLALAGALRQNA